MAADPIKNLQKKESEKKNFSSMDFFILWKIDMDKNGQNRGGARKGAGRPKKSNSDIQIFNSPESPKKDLKEFMKAAQKGGYELMAMDVFTDIKDWLKKAGMKKEVPDQLLMLYAMSFARWMQMEERLSKYGFQTQHPTTNQPMASQFIKIAMDYARQTSAAWQQIAQIIKDNTTDKRMIEEPSNSLMDMLRARREANG